MEQEPWFRHTQWPNLLRAVLLKCKTPLRESPSDEAKLDEVKKTSAFILCFHFSYVFRPAGSKYPS